MGIGPQSLFHKTDIGPQRHRATNTPGLKNCGFSISQLSENQMFLLQCNASHLPSDVRSLLLISISRVGGGGAGQKVLLATLSEKDGARLEPGGESPGVYVSGVYDDVTLESTSLRLLMTREATHTDVVYVCKVGYLSPHADIHSVTRNISLTHVDRLFPTTQKPRGLFTNAMPRNNRDPTDSTPFWEVGSSEQLKDASLNFLSTPMLVTMCMGVVLVFLLIVCVVLVIARCRDKEIPTDEAYPSSYTTYEGRGLDMQRNATGFTSQGQESISQHYSLPVEYDDELCQ